jgi:indolepyruvate ferredoxin oxidoreductase beta subunit
MKEFNIIISGVGGQGVITLTRILAKAAVLNGYDVKTSELHGLSQKGGSVETHIRFGALTGAKQIHSPLIGKGKADLIICIEAQESLKSYIYGSKKSGTIFLINDFIKPILDSKIIPQTKDILKETKRFSKNSISIPASKITKEKLEKEVLSGVYLLGYATSKKLLPLETKFILESIKKTVPKKYFLLNKKAFDLANYD